MQYTGHYHSDMGEILLAADEIGLTGLWFYGQKYFARSLEWEHEEKDLPIFAEAKRWLDLYFAGEEPNFSVALHLIGTDFQKAVWEILCRIPYGHTAAYADLAGQLAEERGIAHRSAQAVGGAVSCNPVSVIVPCHRVIRKNGELGGYAAGAEKKAALLRLEKIRCSKTPIDTVGV